jgi:hypothetical protein
VRTNIFFVLKILFFSSKKVVSIVNPGEDSKDTVELSEVYSKKK